MNTYKISSFIRSPTDAQVTGEIDCSRDIRIGRSKTQMVSAENLANDAGWRHLAYTADGKVAQLFPFFKFNMKIF